MSPRDLPDGGDFVLSLDPGGPDWHLDSVVYEIFPDRFATTGAAAGVTLPDWAVRRDVGRASRGTQPQHAARAGSAATCRGIEQRLDHVEQLGANALYLTPVFPAGSTHRYDATSFDHVDPLLGGDAALASLVAARARARHARHRRPDAEPLRRRSRVVPARARERRLAGARLLLLRRLVPARLRLVVRREVVAEARPSQPRAPAPPRRRARVGRGEVAAAAVRVRRLADRRRQHGRAPSRRRPHATSSRARCGPRSPPPERRAARRRARPRLPRRPPGRSAGTGR